MSSDPAPSVARSTEVNRRNWDERVPVHVASAFYDVDGFIKGGCKLKPVDVEEVGDVQDKRLLHLQCHFGLDTLSWARRGAQVVGLDFSEPAIVAARDIAARAKLDAEFVASDVHDAVSALDIGTTREPFDILFTGVGALCWLPDVARWAKIAAACVKPGGTLYLREGHPMMWAMADSPSEDGRHALRYPYFEMPSATVESYDSTYADSAAKFETRESHSWNHGLGETITALIAAGFDLEFLHEHKESDWQAFTHMVKTGEHDMWQLPDKREQLPLMYSLRAVRRR